MGVNRSCNNYLWSDSLRTPTTSIKASSVPSLSLASRTAWDTRLLRISSELPHTARGGAASKSRVGVGVERAWHEQIPPMLISWLNSITWVSRAFIAWRIPDLPSFGDRSVNTYKHPGRRSGSKWMRQSANFKTLLFDWGSNSAKQTRKCWLHSFPAKFSPRLSRAHVVAFACSLFIVFPIKAPASFAERHPTIFMSSAQA